MFARAIAGVVQIGRWAQLDRLRDASEPEGQRTIITETPGILIGKRAVRGRESEYRTFYKIKLQ